MSNDRYLYNVFINCPFDQSYLKLRNALVFTIYDCGFTPRCALEVNTSGIVRVDKIRQLIEESKFGIHDISRVQIDKKTQLPRFNMPLELGVFLGAKYFGDKTQRSKNCLILDKEKWRYRAFISDIAGHDICSHRNSPNEIIKQIRDWLSDSSDGNRKIPGGNKIAIRFKKFEQAIPDLCKEAKIAKKELTFMDYSRFISEWLKNNAVD